MVKLTLKSMKIFRNLKKNLNVPLLCRTTRSFSGWNIKELNDNYKKAAKPFFINEKSSYSKKVNLVDPKDFEVKVSKLESDVTIVTEKSSLPSLIGKLLL